MNIFENPNRELWSELFKRPEQNRKDIEATVNQIFDDVKRQGDKAIAKYTGIFDGVELDSFLISKDEIAEATLVVPNNLKKAIIQAKSHIERFHKAQKTEKITVETTEGVLCWQEKRAIANVGLYIPGGTAPLFSTVLMLAIPAKLAGCKEITLCSPPDKEGKIAPEIIYAAKLCGVDRILKAGGIQAIAGMTFGTESFPKVYKIFGPGNQFVTSAKQYATTYGVAIDMPAGPSELLVVADTSADASYVASDLLSQAEHGVDSQVMLISTSIEFMIKVVKQIDKQLKDLPRQLIAQEVIKNAVGIVVKSKENILEMINEYAPEHLIICTENDAYFCDNVENAGSVFVGNFTPESAGDYASGTNHTLPTNGYCKAYSGVNLDSFLKSITFQKISENGLKQLGNVIELMAEAEGLQAHKNAVSIRLKNLQS